MNLLSIPVKASEPDNTVPYFFIVFSGIVFSGIIFSGIACVPLAGAVCCFAGATAFLAGVDMFDVELAAGMDFVVSAWAIPEKPNARTDTQTIRRRFIIPSRGCLKTAGTGYVFMLKGTIALKYRLPF